jgi:hypothetical protein
MNAYPKTGRRGLLTCIVLFSCATFSFSAPIIVNNPALSNATIGVAYTPETFTASNGTAPYTFTIASGSLPAGMSLSPGGVLSGKPTAAGVFNFSVSATDINGKSGPPSAASLTVSPPTILLAPAALAGAMYKTPYSLTVTASGGTPPYTFTAIGLPPGMSVSASGILAGTPTAAGTYTVSIRATDNSTGTGAPFFAIKTYTLVISKANLIVTANNQTMPPGGPLPALTVSYSGFANGDNASSLTTQPTATTTATAASPIGTYPITPGGGVSANYNFSYVNGTLTVGKPVLTITANPAGSTYGSPLVPNSSLTVSYSGFTNGDGPGSLTAPPVVVNTASAGAPAGAYAIIPSGAVDPKYTIVYKNGVYKINPASLTIQANNALMAYSTNVPPLTLTYSGFVNGDAVSSLTTQPTVSTPATKSSNVGTYPITASGAVDPNYTITYIPGTLRILPRELTVIADDQTMNYGGAVPALTVSYYGFVNGETPSVLTTQATATTTATSASPAGYYSIDPSGVVSLNYNITYISGTLTINPDSLSVSANAQTKIYGSADPALTYAATGFVNGDNSGIFTGSLTRDSGENVGTYAIREGTLSAGNNYIINFTGNDLTITKAPQQITWVQSLVAGCNGITQLQLTATSNSGLPITYIPSDAAMAAVSGDMLTVLQPGSSLITATQQGDSNHFAATPVTDTVVYLNSSLVRQHWSDALFFDNTSDSYVQWQWYKNGSPIQGATAQLYSESPSLNGIYYVIATDNTGHQIQTCPLTVTGGGAIPGGIKVVPNPVTAGGSVNIISNYDATVLQGAQIQIVDITGRVWKQIANVQPTMPVTMPTTDGIYVINLLLSNGQKASVNVLVIK